MVREEGMPPLLHWQSEVWWQARRLDDESLLRCAQLRSEEAERRGEHGHREQEEHDYLACGVRLLAESLHSRFSL